jgi:hypothetical protein
VDANQFIEEGIYIYKINIQIKKVLFSAILISNMVIGVITTESADATQMVKSIDGVISSNTTAIKSATTTTNNIKYGDVNKDDAEIIIVRNGGQFGALVPTFEVRADSKYLYLN